MPAAVVKTIHWVCHSPSPYNDQLFRSLSDALPVPILFHFMEEASSAHPWKYEPARGFQSHFYHRWFGIDWNLVASVCRDSNSLFVTDAWQDPTSQIILLFLIVTNRLYLIWTDTPLLNRKRNQLKRVLRRVFLKIVLKKAYAVMGTGKLALSVLTQMGCPPEKLINFPYFIDIADFSSADHRKLDKAVIFGSCGRLHHDKGFDLALRALAAAFGDRSISFRYRLAGAGPETDALKALAQDLGIAGNVDFLGWLHPGELPNFYRTVDFFIHPARMEPYGVSVLEAMASGSVVIASDETAAALDRIESGVNGFLHVSNNVYSLSQTLARMLELPDKEIERIRSAARRTAEKWPTGRGVQILSRIIWNLIEPSRPTTCAEVAEKA